MLRKVKLNINGKFLAFSFALFALSISTAKTQSTGYCQQNEALTIGGWSMAPSNTQFYDGQVIGTAVGVTVYYYSGYEKQAFVDGGGRGIGSYSYGAIPMPQVPGVGVRVKWSGQWVHGSYSFSVTQQKPVGTIVSSPSWGSLLIGEAAGSFIISYRFEYEIVVIDADKYKGGKPVFTNEADISAMVYSNNASGGRRECNGGKISLLEALVNNGGVPELPKPPAPTCASTDLNRVVNMRPVTVSQVADYGSSRSSGMIAEQTFELIGRRCPVGTTIKAFFTDTRASSETKNYLQSSHSSVGVRLYHRDSQQAIDFGPAPLGSTLPDRAPVLEGPTSNSLSDIHLPITAQYVQLPHVQSGTITPGSMRAAAVVTVIYD